ncbi:putative transmembrane protein [Roseivivax marinus]|uniref:Putative transmembrane protein n=1 Tax=Roseivivax marinus TaxID=1379903 RepID=W4HPQ1_9RHOB|nr:DMT family transporter [Roseivivax marinus]ETW14747.1 putative transmembrane protein [Roseivivax marinus]
MSDETRRASLIVVATGILWGLYWMPVRALSGAGLGGAWGTLAIVAAAALCLAPLVLARRRLSGLDTGGVAATALGGAAFVLYSVGLVHGRVAVIILLFFLTPVWSVLIGRALGWPTPALRLAAIAVGLAGLAIMLGGEGQVPLPRGTGEWLALASGLMWSVATTGIRLRPTLPAPEAAFVFACGATLGAVLLAPVLAAPPRAAELGAGTVAMALGAGALWWGLSMASLMWATSRLDPARVGLLLMSEVLVGALTAAWVAGERLSPTELAGGALVLSAAILELWPVRAPRG